MVEAQHLEPREHCQGGRQRVCGADDAGHIQRLQLGMQACMWAHGGKGARLLWPRNKHAESHVPQAHNTVRPP